LRLEAFTLSPETPMIEGGRDWLSLAVSNPGAGRLLMERDVRAAYALPDATIAKVRKVLADQ
jgi:hypothetical protein